MRTAAFTAANAASASATNAFNALEGAHPVASEPRSPTPLDDE